MVLAPRLKISRAEQKTLAKRPTVEIGHRRHDVLGSGIRKAAEEYAAAWKAGRK